MHLNKSVFFLYFYPDFYFQAVEVKPSSKGVWKVKYGSTEQHSLKVTGVSKLKLDYGFSAKDAKSMSETTNRPLEGKKVEFS